MECGSGGREVSDSGNARETEPKLSPLLRKSGLVGNTRKHLSVTPIKTYLFRCFPKPVDIQFSELVP